VTAEHGEQIAFVVFFSCLEKLARLHREKVLDSMCALNRRRFNARHALFWRRPSNPHISRPIRIIPSAVRITTIVLIVAVVGVGVGCSCGRLLFVLLVVGIGCSCGRLLFILVLAVVVIVIIVKKLRLSMNSFVVSFRVGLDQANLIF
jgi:hypothetical protein